MKKYLLFSCIAVLVTASSVSAESAPLSDAQLNSVLANCSVAQVTLGRVQQSDKPARINRGFRYDSLLKLMVKLNTRVAQSRIDAPALFSTISNYEKEIKAFTQTYTSYDDALTDIQKMDCKETPTDFYDSLTRIRDSRTRLEGHIAQIDTYLDEYQKSINDLRTLVIEDKGSVNE
jgi:hypothetical protein